MINGTIGFKDYINNTNECCYVFYMIDVDDIPTSKIIEHKKEIEERDGILILSKPSFEIVLLALFDNNISYNTSNISDRLTKSLIDKRILKSNEKYNKENMDSLKKIIKYIINNNNEQFINNWLNNLSKIEYKDENNILFNNYQIIINFLKNRII